jgi:hypothetical protein
LERAALQPINMYMSTMLAFYVPDKTNSIESPGKANG